jgi:hypothetical protein
MDNDPWDPVAWGAQLIPFVPATRTGTRDARPLDVRLKELRHALDKGYCTKTGVLLMVVDGGLAK